MAIVRGVFADLLKPGLVDSIMSIFPRGYTDPRGMIGFNPPLVLGPGDILNTNGQHYNLTIFDDLYDKES